MMDSLEHATDSLGELAAQIKKTVARVERKRSHKLRNALLLAGGTAALAAAALATRRLLHNRRPSVEAEIEVGVPVTTAYEQWTQFEELPPFMDGIDSDAKIVERKPDRRITWTSIDGKSTWGTVTFEPRGAERSLVHLHMSTQPDAADEERINADLARFRERVEERYATTP
jgi:uncharacterized membrane protein